MARVRSLFLAVTAAMFVVAGGAVHAAESGPRDDAVALYRVGQFLDAAKLARTGDSAADLALAARATLAQASLLEVRRSDDIALYQRAEADARKALIFEPDHVEAHLQLAIALGHMARLAGPLSSRMQPLAEEAKRHIDRGLEIEPESAWGNALLGVWHMTMAHRAGWLLAKVVYGADWNSGRRLFSRALSLAPNNILLRHFYGKALSMRRAEPDVRVLAEQALQKALTMQPTDRLDEETQQSAALLLNELQQTAPSDSEMVGGQ